MKANLLRGIALVGSLTLFGACQDPTISRSDDGNLLLGSYEASDVVERVISPGQRSLVLEGFTGSIHLTGDDSDVARLQITRRARGDTPAEAEGRLANLDIEETGDDASFRYNFGASDRATSSFDIEGTVPANTPVRIEWVAGDIDVGGLIADIEVRNRHGGIAYSGPSSKVHLRTRNGDVSAALAAAGPQSNVDLVANNGDVSLLVSPEASVRIVATTSAGSIRTGRLSFVSESYSPMDAGSRFEGRIAQGTGRIMISTEHGSVDIGEYVPQIQVHAEAPDTTDSAAGAAPDSVIAAPDSVIASPEDAAAVVTQADSLK